MKTSQLGQNIVTEIKQLLETRRRINVNLTVKVVKDLDECVWQLVSGLLCICVGAV